MERPVGIPATYDEHAKLMFDLQVLAYQTDLTRVITFMMGREGRASRTYPEDRHRRHAPHRCRTTRTSREDREAGRDQHAITCKMFAYYLEKLRSTPDGDGNLLDHSMLMYGSGLSDGNMHLRTSLPMLLVGGGGGQIKGGRHLGIRRTRR